MVSQCFGDSDSRTPAAAGIVSTSNPCQTNQDGRGDADRSHPGRANRGRRTRWNPLGPDGISTDQRTRLITRRSQVQIPPPLRREPLGHPHVPRVFRVARLPVLSLLPGVLPASAGRSLRDDQALEHPGRFGLHAWEHVLVGVDREHRVSASEPLADHFDRYPGGVEGCIGGGDEDPGARNRDAHGSLVDVGEGEAAGREFGDQVGDRFGVELSVGGILCVRGRDPGLGGSAPSVMWLMVRGSAGRLRTSERSSLRVRRRRGADQRRVR